MKQTLFLYFTLLLSVCFWSTEGLELLRIQLTGPDANPQWKLSGNYTSENKYILTCYKTDTKAGKDDNPTTAHLFYDKQKEKIAILTFDDCSDERNIKGHLAFAMEYEAHIMKILTSSGEWWRYTLTPRQGERREGNTMVFWRGQEYSIDTSTTVWTDKDVNNWRNHAIKLLRIQLPGPGKGPKWTPSGQYINNRKYILKCFKENTKEEIKKGNHKATTAHLFGVDNANRIATLTFNDCSDLSKINGLLAFELEYDILIMKIFDLSLGEWVRYTLTPSGNESTSGDLLVFWRGSGKSTVEAAYVWSNYVDKKDVRTGKPK